MPLNMEYYTTANAAWRAYEPVQTISYSAGTSLVSESELNAFREETRHEIVRLSEEQQRLIGVISLFHKLLDEIKAAQEDGNKICIDTYDKALAELFGDLYEGKEKT